MQHIALHLQPLLDKYVDADIFVTRGFICRNSTGEIDNLQRGGSDYTASLIGAAIEADEIEISDRYRRHAQQRPSLRGRHQASQRAPLRRSIRAGLLRRQDPSPPPVCSPPRSTTYLCACSTLLNRSPRHSDLQQHHRTVNQSRGSQRQRGRNQDQKLPHAYGLRLSDTCIRDIRKIPHPD